MGPDPGFDFLMRIEPSTRYFGGTGRVSANPMLLPIATIARMSHLYRRSADEMRPSCSLRVVVAGAIEAGGPQAAPPGRYAEGIPLLGSAGTRLAGIRE